MIYDFLFVYEVKARELENICLLKCELERRGYTVAMCETWYYQHHRINPIEAKAVIVSALYKNTTIKFMCSFAKNPTKVINMFWEQIYRVGDRLAEKSLYVLKEDAIHAVHVAWGENTVRWLKERCRFPDKSILVAGHIGMDFLKPRFNDYYMSKEEIIKKYSLSEYKKVFLFISSFAYVGLPDAVMAEDLNDASSTEKEFQMFSVQSQKIVLQWIEEVLIENKEAVFVYRPHPSENKNRKILIMQEKYANFKVIETESVKQWIKISDKIYTWISTSIGEIYFSGNACGILRPLPLKEVDEMEIYVGAKNIISKESFKKDLEQNTLEFPVDTEIINRFYMNDGSYTYMKICDFCEEIIKDDSYSFGFFENEKMSLLKKIKIDVRLFILRSIACIFDFSFMEKCINKLTDSNKQKIENLLYTRHLIKRNHAMQKEINKIEEKIRKCIYNTEIDFK